MKTEMSLEIFSADDPLDRFWTARWEEEGRKREFSSSDLLTLEEAHRFLNTGELPNGVWKKDKREVA